MNHASPFLKAYFRWLWHSAYAWRGHPFDQGVLAIVYTIYKDCMQTGMLTGSCLPSLKQAGSNYTAAVFRNCMKGAGDVQERQDHNKVLLVQSMCVCWWLWLGDFYFILFFLHKTRKSCSHWLMSWDFIEMYGQSRAIYYLYLNVRKAGVKQECLAEAASLPNFAPVRCGKRHFHRGFEKGTGSSK